MNAPHSFSPPDAIPLGTGPEPVVPATEPNPAGTAPTEPLPFTDPGGEPTEPIPVQPGDAGEPGNPDIQRQPSHKWTKRLAVGATVVAAFIAGKNSGSTTEISSAPVSDPSATAPAFEEVPTTLGAPAETVVDVATTVAQTEAAPVTNPNSSEPATTQVQEPATTVETAPTTTVDQETASFLDALQSTARFEQISEVLSGGDKLLESLAGKDSFVKVKDEIKVGAETESGQDNAVQIDTLGIDLGQSKRVGLEFTGITSLPIDATSPPEIDGILASGLQVDSMTAFFIVESDNSMIDSQPGKYPYRTFVKISQVGDAFVYRIEKMNDAGDIVITDVSGNGVETQTVTAQDGNEVTPSTRTTDIEALRLADEALQEAMTSLATTISE